MLAGDGEARRASTAVNECPVVRRLVPPRLAILKISVSPPQLIKWFRGSSCARICITHPRLLIESPAAPTTRRRVRPGAFAYQYARVDLLVVCVALPENWVICDPGMAVNVTMHPTGVLVPQEHTIRFRFRSLLRALGAPHNNKDSYAAVCAVPLKYDCSSKTSFRVAHSHAMSLQSCKSHVLFAALRNR